MDEHEGDVDALVTALDGRRLDINLGQDALDAPVVILAIEHTGFVQLTATGARDLAAQLLNAAEVLPQRG